MALVAFSAAVFVIGLTPAGQCRTPAYPSLALGGPPIVERPAVCLLGLPVLLYGAAGVMVGGVYLRRARPASGTEYR